MADNQSERRLELKVTPYGPQVKAAAEKLWCTCGAKTPQGKYHKSDCPAYKNG